MPDKPNAVIPVHVGIIMDGNGRWAKARGLSRTEGHREGLKTAKRIVAEADRLGVKFVSLYAFSTENWRRASEEVGFLMGLIKTYLAAEFDFYREHRVRVVHSGDPGGLPPDILETIRQVAADTAGFDGITVNLAINYGGRDEIVRAARKAAESGDLTEAGISARMDVPGLPDPDLVIRTSGERRLSNFLLWQSAYSELYFSERLWPDFSEADLGEAIRDYGLRDRRFGGTK